MDNKKFFDGLEDMVELSKQPREPYKLDTNPIVPITRAEWDSLKRDIVLGSKGHELLKLQPCWVHNDDLFTMFEQSTNGTLERPIRRDVFLTQNDASYYIPGTPDVMSGQDDVMNDLGFPEKGDVLFDTFTGPSSNFVRVKYLGNNRALIASYFPFKSYPKDFHLMDYTVHKCGRVKKILASKSVYIKQKTSRYHQDPNSHCIVVPLRIDLVELEMGKPKILTTLSQEMTKDFFSHFNHNIDYPIDYPVAFMKWLLSGTITIDYLVNIYRFKLEFNNFNEELIDELIVKDFLKSIEFKLYELR